MAVRKELIEELLANRNPEEVFAQDGLLDELKKALAERILNAEMDQHLAAERADEAIGEPRNHRNGHSRKTVLTGTGKLDLQVPRDRQASFEPQLIAKYRRRFPDFDDKVVSLYARGMTVREIQGHLRELYGVEVSPDLISVVTDAVLEQVAEWQNRPLDALYALVFRCVAGEDPRRGNGAEQGMLRWVFGRTAARRFLACGLSRPKAPSSGCG